MTDHLIPLPSNFRYVYQFSSGTSQYKCVESCLSMAGQIAYPDRYANPSQLMDQIYTQYVGPDVASDTKGTTAAQAIEWLQSQHIGFIVMDCSNLDTLHSQLQEMNLAGVPQIISIGDESFLHDAKTGLILHNWAAALNHGSHAMLRVGFSDSDPWGFYYEPAAAPNFAEPVAIDWQDFVNGSVVGCIAILPHGMQQYPPAPPKPVFDLAKAESTLMAMSQAAQAMQAAAQSMLQDIAALKQEGV